MTLPIIEQPLYGEVLIETSPWATPFVWSDRTASLVAGFNYSQGGRVGTPGSSQVDVGTLNATFKNLASVPAVGELVRISFSKFAGYAFVGYVQDVSQRIVFDNSVSYTTPITLTTLNCVDWVGYVSQFQLVGMNGIDIITGTDNTTSQYTFGQRVAAINKSIDPTYATKMLTPITVGSFKYMGDTDYVGSISEHLNLVSNSAQTYWFAKNVIPTNKTTGRTGLIEVHSLASQVSSGYVFTDSAGTAGQLHYTEIDLENSTQNIGNEIVLNNRTRVDIIQPELTRIGGFNETNFMIVNNKEVVGIGIDREEKASDSTSITTYGNRQSVFDTNIPLSFVWGNYISNPSAEYSDDGYSGIANSKVRRRQPLQDANPFAAYDGLWAMRARQSTAAASTRIVFSGGESDGIPVVGGITYTIKAQAARGTISRTDMISSMTIDWYNDDETVISSSTTANTTLTTANTWYLVTGGFIAPATAVRATIRMSFARSGGGNISVGDRLWSDAWLFHRGGAPFLADDYFDGDTTWVPNYSYGWTGGVGTSQSMKMSNLIDNMATEILARYSTTSIRATRIRWNAQEKLSAIPSLSVGKTLSLVYKGTTTTYRIVGIDGNVDPERYMIDYYLVKV
jgi:hypothetical protein